MERLPTPVFWPGEFLGGHKELERLSDFHFGGFLGSSNGKNLQVKPFLIEKIKKNRENLFSNN